MVELVVELLAGVGLDVVLMVDAPPLKLVALAELVMPPAASSLAALALVWCRTERMWISRVELWLYATLQVLHLNGLLSGLLVGSGWPVVDS